MYCNVSENTEMPVGIQKTSTVKPRRDARLAAFAAVKVRGKVQTPPSLLVLRAHLPNPTDLPPASSLRPLGMTHIAALWGWQIVVTWGGYSAGE